MACLARMCAVFLSIISTFCWYSKQSPVQRKRSLDFRSSDLAPLLWPIFLHRTRLRSPFVSYSHTIKKEHVQLDPWTMPPSRKYPYAHDSHVLRSSPCHNVTVQRVTLHVFSDQPSSGIFFKLLQCTTSFSSVSVANIFHSSFHGQQMLRLVKHRLAQK